MSATPIDTDAVADVTTSLEVCDIVKSFGAVKALRGVSFTAHAGEVLGLLGDNGAGKTTLVKCLAGILAPDSGRILINGSRADISSPKASRSLGIETVHQDLSLIDSLDVAGNLFLNREEIRGPKLLQWFGWMNQPQMRRDAKATLDSLHINIPSVRRPIQRLSGGQRQAVAVGRAVAWGQRIVIMDEPSAALGVEQTRLVLDLIRQLQQRNILVVLITHNMQQVVEVCTRAVVLRHGTVAGDIAVGPESARDLVDLITGAG
ncbi:MAG: ATP-binding cassette domain-containing protein [Candidatus Nanopelagicales bacterium]